MTDDPPASHVAPAPADDPNGAAAPADEAVGAPAPSGSPPRAGRQVGLIVLVAGLGLAVLASLGAAGALFTVPVTTATVRSPWPDADGRAAERAARECVVEFLSVSGKTAAEDVERVLACSTGEFHEQWATRQGETRKALVANRVDSSATVRESAVVDADADTATVLLAVDAQIRNTRTPEGQVTSYRVSVDMSLVGGQWKVERLAFVG